MRFALALCIALPLLAPQRDAAAQSAPPTPAPKTIEFRNGRWLGSRGFAAGTRYVSGRVLTMARPAHVDSVIDLQGGYVVPPFGEAHNHNLDYSTPQGTRALISRYLRDGVFYVKNPANLPRGRDAVAPYINRPTGVDGIFSNGVLTATGGHPTGLYLRNLARGGMTAADGDGGFLWLIDTPADLEARWPRIVAGRPNFIKTILVHSEEYERRRDDSTYFNWRGLNPALMPDIVRRAHAAGLRVTAHVETGADFHNALMGGVDEITHIPGFRGDEHVQLPDPRLFHVSEADARLAARRGVVVVTTLGGVVGVTDAALRKRFDSLAVRNLGVLRRAGVHLAVGSDNYRGDSSEEAAYLSGLGVFTPLELLRLWSEATPRAIFPTRRVGCLRPGCEASFLVLEGDPSSDFAQTRHIRMRVKDGLVLPQM